MTQPVVDGDFNISTAPFLPRVSTALQLAHLYQHAAYVLTVYRIPEFWQMRANIILRCMEQL